MDRKFLIAWIVAFIVWMGGSFAVHGVWLNAQYLALGTLYRSADEQMQYMPWLLGAHVIMAGAVAWIYGRGVTAAPWTGQGLRFGVALAALMVPVNMIYYAILPLPMSLLTNQLIGDCVVAVAIGLALAAVHKGGAKA